MSNQIVQTGKAGTAEFLLTQEKVVGKFNSVLGDKANGFITSVIAASKSDLKDADPNSVLTAAMTAATLDLPINKNLGFAYIIPYKRKVNGKFVEIAEFQMGYKGYIQLAIRSGQYKTINAIEVYEGEIKERNRLTGEITFEKDESKINRNKVIGYVAYFSLLNGFEKTLYMTKEEMEIYAKKYSKTYSSKNDSVVKYSKWTTDFDAMALKTVIKQIISKYGIMSIEMQTAISNDNISENIENTVENEIKQEGSKEKLDFDNTVVDTEFTEVKEDIGPASENQEEPSF